MNLDTFKLMMRIVNYYVHKAYSVQQIADILDMEKREVIRHLKKAQKMSPTVRGLVADRKAKKNSIIKEEGEHGQFQFNIL